MTRIAISEARDTLGEVVDRARFTQERTILTKRGKDVGALVPMADLELLERLEDQLDIQTATEALLEARGQRIPYAEVREKLGLDQ